MAIISIMRVLEKFNIIKYVNWFCRFIYCLHKDFCMNLPPAGACIGIWGFGRVGKSVADLLYRMGYPVAIMDSNSNMLSDNNASQYTTFLFTQEQHDQFFSVCDIVVPSPGIDIRGCVSHNHTWLAELDLFYMLWKKPIIAVTGSVGKTTVTSMLGDIGNSNNIPMRVAGNIGNAACTLLFSDVTDGCYALLEVSSFQLEQCKLFVPNLLIITNLYANHLDRHGSYEDYWQAKASALRTMTSTGICIVPWNLREKVRQVNDKITVYYVAIFNSQDELEINMRDEYLGERELLFIFISNPNVHDGQIRIYDDGSNRRTSGEERASCYRTQKMPQTLLKTTLSHNALLLYVASYALTDNTALQISFDIDYLKHEHRLELVPTEKNIICINDSKSTTIVSTQAALERYKNHQTILFLGGLSKGVCREPLVAAVPDNVIEIVCFGAEAGQLYQWCMRYNKKAYAYATLQEAFANITKGIQDQSVLLFSPAGSSYDLYKDYQERGNHFKKLVHKYYCI